ncbi:hypothetical protein C4D60_Mb01t32800 [Musa balbisiana]|uniref:Uncharacterized protein n=1 Tax=Musa balbisiana TaxID=52838 RepID=A0A4S8JSE5_MUSBA|nr:hypothetical protein C4D60_Mb01t32800 [Musa balbisiana]
MAKVACVAMPVEMSSMAVIRWCGGLENKKRQQKMMGFSGRRLRRRRGSTVRLGNMRRRLLLRRLVRWSHLRWRVVVELLGPIRRAVMEMVSRRELVQTQHFALPFICNFPVPLL